MGGPDVRVVLRPVASGPVVGGVGAELVPESERAFYEAEFAGETLVVGLTHVDEAVLAQIGRVSRSLYRTRGQLVLVVDEAHPADGWEGLLTPALGTSPVVLTVGDLDCEWLAELWLAVADGRPVVVDAAGDAAVTVAGRIASSLRVRKLVVTDPAGGWGEPPRSFADVLRPDQGFAADLADRQDGRVVPAIEEALAGGVLSVNLCRADDLDRELYTFDGTGTLFTSGGYVRVEPLRVADLVEVERLVSQGVDAGVLRPRERHEIARIAVDGLGARVLGGDHLAGIVGMDRDDYRDDGMAEVASLYTVSRFSGSGAGGLLIDALVERAAAEGLAALFAVTVSSEAVEFFLRKGFVEVEHDVVPAAKWRGYDPERRRRAVALLRPTDS